MKYISKTVWVLSFVSLFTDTASEMLYPIMPIYLKSIGFSILFIGILEGIAEATAGLTKGYFGERSDVIGKRAPFIQIGYSLSALSKPLMVIFVFPLWVFFARTLDRFGKGLRTGARDAALSDEATPETKGKVFGLHRSMDTLGAVLGPSCALLYLYFYPQEYVTLFYVAFIPGCMAVVVSFLYKDKKIVRDSSLQTKVTFFSFFNYWKHSPIQYRKLVIGLLAFTIFNSSDVFLLLKAKEAGLDDTLVIGVYIFYNLIYALFAFPLGSIADKIGFKKMLIVGLVLFSIVYFGMAFSSNVYAFFVLFFLYGLYSASNEGISKAWISNVIDRNNTATAIGTFSGFQSIFAMMASSFAGLMWYVFGSFTTLMISAIGAMVVVVYFLLLKKEVVPSKVGEGNNSI